MAAETLFWKVKVNGSWVTMPSPSVMDYDWEDADDDSYRNVIDAKLIRNRIRNHLIKISMEFHHISNEKVNTIASAVNTTQTIEIQAKSPAFGNMTSSEGASWYSFVAYISKFNAKTVKTKTGEIVNNMSFNIIEV